MDTMFVKPAPGLKVRHPETRFHIPDEGTRVPRDSYWTRRLVDGDVIEVAPKAADVKKAKE